MSISIFEVASLNEKVKDHNTSLCCSLNRLESELHVTSEALHEISIKLEKSKKEQLEVLNSNKSYLTETQKLKSKVKDKEDENKTMKFEANKIKFLIQI